MVLISFPHPQPISCLYSKNMQYPTQARNAESQHRANRCCCTGIRTHTGGKAYCSRTPAKANWHPKKGVSMRYRYIPLPKKSRLPPAGYLHLLYNSGSQRVFRELLRVPEILPGDPLGQNYFYHNTRMLPLLLSFMSVEWRFERLQ